MTCELNPTRAFWLGHLYHASALSMPLTRLIHEAGPKTKIADGILLKIQCVPPRIPPVSG